MSPSLALREEISFKKRKRVAKIALTAILVCVFLAVFLSVAQAEPKSTGNYNVPSTFSEDTLSEDDLYGLVGSISTTDTFDAVDRILGAGFYKEFVTAPNAPGKRVSDAMVGIAIVFSIIYGFIHAFQIFSRGELNLDMGVKIAMTFVLSFLFVIYSNDIANVVDKVGYALKDYVATVIRVEIPFEDPEGEQEEQSDSEEISVLDQGIKIHGIIYGATHPFDIRSNKLKILSKMVGWIKDKYEETTGNINNTLETAEQAIDFMSDPLAAMRSIIVSMFLQILNTLLLYAIAASAFGLYISFALRRAFLPLAVADVTAEGLRSPGVQYIKTYFSIYLEFAYFYVIAALSTLMENYAFANINEAAKTNSIFGAVGAVICIRLAVSAALRKSSEFAKSVVGVH